MATRTITVHAFGDERVHLAPAHFGRMRQGRLKTLCGKLAVTELSPFAAAAAASARCRVCFGKVDADGNLKAAAGDEARKNAAGDKRSRRRAPKAPSAKPGKRTG